MNKILNYVFKDNQYYPTPKELVRDILGQIYRYKYGNDGWDEINFLEPCAGDGAICREVKKYFEEDKTTINIDCIEIENVLRDSLKGQGFNLIAHDFEKFNSIPFYNLIIMNPPFSKGAKFILKAYEMLSGNGELICILNAETIHNPCTRERELLKNLIERTGELEFKDKEFLKSERKTDVDIAIVHLRKPLYENEFDMFGKVQGNIMSEDELLAEKFKETVNKTDLMSFNKLEHAISLYRNCVKQIFKGITTIQDIKTSLSYLDKEAQEFNIDMEKFFKIILEEEEADEAKAKSIKIIRKMIWSFVLKFCKMDQCLFYKQRSEFYDKLDKGSANLPFTKENIQQFFDNIFYQREEYFKKGIEDLFNEITSYHHGNTRHTEGWKTNKKWKINKKIIVNWGVEFTDYGQYMDRYSNAEKRYGEFRTQHNRDWIDDLDKLVRKIQPENAKGSLIKEALNRTFQWLGKVYVGEPFDNTCETPYFNLRFFKKGTLHIMFKDKKVLDELNMMGAKLRTDLGYDDYGKKNPNRGD
jgi:hypothetical protein